jgi:5-methylcytosine-specific restriction endonuclease McrA
MSKRDLILGIVRTDNTFKDNGEGWTGKCLHCKAKLHVTLTGRLVGKATIEHIIPQCYGGTNELTNIALACKTCNNQKGVDVDPLGPNNEKYQRVITLLLERRTGRWREVIG